MEPALQHARDACTTISSLAASSWHTSAAPATSTSPGRVTLAVSLTSYLALPTIYRLSVLRRLVLGRYKHTTGPRTEHYSAPIGTGGCL